MGYLSKDTAQLRSGDTFTIPLFIFTLLLWPWGLPDFCLHLYIFIPIYASPNLSCLHHLVCSSHKCSSYSDLEAPLASEKPFRLPLCILTHSVISASAYHKDRLMLGLRASCLSALPPAHLILLGSPGFPFPLHRGLSLCPLGPAA